ncbi:MAG: HD domain-containing protein [Chloroflexota bacterium]
MSIYAALVNLLGQANHLKMLPRTGWLFAGVAHPESVADHSYATALLVLCLGEAINQSWAEESLAAPLDLGYAVKIALIHDLAEAKLTDLPKRATDLIGQEVKHQAEEDGMKEILAGLLNEDDMVQLWQEYCHAASPEARLVKDADKLEMIYQASRYERQGFTELSDFFIARQWSYRASERLFRQICLPRQDAPNTDEEVI